MVQLGHYMSLVRTRPSTLSNSSLNFPALDLAGRKSFGRSASHRQLLQAKDPDHWGLISGEHRA
jgi:hypothetical protein